MIKLQIGCMMILLFIAVIYFSVKRVNTYSHKIFSASLCVTIFYLTFDMITVYTVNHLEMIVPWRNWLYHILFLGSLMLEIYICFSYTTTLIYEDEETARRKNRRYSIPVICAFAGLLLLPLYYVETPRGNYSWGAAVFMVYFVIVIYLLLAGLELICHWKRVNPKKRSLVLLAYTIQLVISCYQALVPTSLIACIGITMINLAFFLTVESPDVHLIERLKEEKERADEANEAKSVFLSNMSHEIRTPMNAIVGLTEVLLRKDWPQEETGYLMNIQSSGNALLSLINDLLDFSKIEAGKFVISEDTYDIAQMLRDIRIIGKTRIGDRPIKLEMDIDAAVPALLYGDALRIRQVILNLMNNAIKFTDGGTVTLTVKVTQRREEKAKLFVSVRDTGQGIRQEDLQKLFDAFTQVDIKKNRGKEGTGLGLAISRQLVELMGGELQVESEYGKGSEFFFALWQGVCGDETIGDLEATDDSGKKRHMMRSSGFRAPEAHVLLVEDNLVNQQVVLAMLGPLQMKIDIAENGQKALEKIQEKRYDLIFMDHYMPVMDGVETTVAIRSMEDEYYRKVPILALTADAVAGVKEHFLKIGMNDFLAKPMDMRDVCEKLRKWLP